MTPTKAVALLMAAWTCVLLLGAVVRGGIDSWLSVLVVAVFTVIVTLGANGNGKERNENQVDSGGGDAGGGPAAAGRDVADQPGDPAQEHRE